MVHDEYYERQRALIERSLLAESERKQAYQELCAYRHEVNAKNAYYRLQHTKRHRIVRECKGYRTRKRPSDRIEKGARMLIATKRFPNSYITVTCKSRPY